MNVLIICNSASGLYDFRGMLLNKLISLGHSVKAVVPSVDIPADLESKEKLKEDGITLIHVRMERRGMNPVKDLGLMRNFFKIVKREKPDLVVTYTVKPNAYGGIACRLCRVPYAANITGLGTAFQGSGMLRKLVTTLYKTAFRRAKVVFFENGDNRDTIVNAGIIEKARTVVLHGAGVDLEKYRLLPYPTGNAETKFLFIGRVMKERALTSFSLPCGSYRRTALAVTWMFSAGLMKIIALK